MPCAQGTVNVRVEHGDVSVRTLRLEEIQNSVLLDLVSTAPHRTEIETPAPTYWREAVKLGWGLG